MTSRLKALLLDADGKPLWIDSAYARASFVSDLAKDKTLTATLIELVNDKEALAKVVVPLERDALLLAKSLLEFKPIYQRLSLLVNQLSQDIDEIFVKLEKQKVFDVKGKSYHENQVLKRIISEEITALNIDVNLANQNASKLSEAIESVSQIHLTQYYELTADIASLPLSYIQDKLQQIPVKKNLNEAIALIVNCQEYIMPYRTAIEASRERNDKLVYEYLTAYLQQFTQRLELDYHLKNSQQ